MTGGQTHKVIVVGGGLAGIAAAVRLSKAGVAVMLLETRQRLGGRATSHVDPRNGEPLDNCQHVVLKCCTEYLELARDMGVQGLFDWHREQYWVEAGGRVSVIRPGVLPPPAHYAGSFLAARFLSLTEKAAVGRGLLAMRRIDPQSVAHRTLGDILRDLRQPARAVARFWSPIIVGACNLDVDAVSARPALKVIRDGFLSAADAAVLGLARVPLVRLYDRVPEIIENAGGAVRLGVGVDRVAGGTVIAGDERLEADAVVCALPPERAAAVVDPADAAPWTDLLAGMRFSPILGVHLEFGRPVLPLPHCVLVDRPTHWFFRKDAEGRRVHAVVSAADAWLGKTRDQIVEAVVADLHACFPDTEGVQPIAALPIMEKRATFAATPATEIARKRGFMESSRGFRRLVLAGDYLDTGWPATMEGAVRSGNAAAGFLLEELGAIPATASPQVPL